MRITRNIIIVAALLLLLPCFVASQAELLKTGSQGDAVLRVQTRLVDLGYFNTRPTGVFGGKTRSSVIAFQEYNEIMADGSIGDQTMAKLFSVSVIRNTIASDVEMPIGPGAVEGEKTFGAAMPWQQVDALFIKGEPILVTDFNTGKTFSVTRLGGTKHAEVACSSEADTKVFLSVFGGEPNWSKRPVIVHFPGNDVAASLQGMNHGEESVEGNGLSGYCCMYFESSTSHFSSYVDVEHRSNIQKASNQ